MKDKAVWNILIGRYSTKKKSLKAFAIANKRYKTAKSMVKNFFGDVITMSQYGNFVYNNYDDLHKVEGILIESSKDALLDRTIKTGTQKTKMHTELLDLRKLVKKYEKEYIGRKQFFNSMESVVKKIKPLKVKKQKIVKSNKNLILEVLLSDIQMGKLTDNYDSNTSKSRIRKYTSEILSKIDEYSNRGHNTSKIIVGCLGDLIESSTKHDDSARATDTDNPQQLTDVTVSLLNDFIIPLSAKGIPIEFHGIAGNHDWEGNGIPMFKAGLRTYTHTIYKFLELACEKLGLNIDFRIPNGTYSLFKIFNSTGIYEHGVGVKADAKSLSDRLSKIALQHKCYIDMYRMGDKHHISRFNLDRYIINGAFFGTDQSGSEYNSVMGFCNEPAQLILFHKKSKGKESTIFGSHVILLSN